MIIDLSRFRGSNSRNLRSTASALFLLITMILGLAEIYACRYQLNPDAMDYLDIAREIASGHWAALANGYWGTFNSFLLAPLFALHLSPATELVAAHFHSFLILMVAFFSFQWLLHTWLDLLHRESGSAADIAPLPEFGLCLLGYALFLWSSLEIVPVAMIGPDLLVTAVIYLATAILLRLRDGAAPHSFCLFGFILGIGYWVKAIMFPVGLIFLFMAGLRASHRKKVAISAVTFVMVAAPLVIALSLQRGRFSFGDSGSLNYATFVSPGGRVINWQGQPAGSGIPKHPTREIPGPVPIYEFHGAGTYPPSYDPAYWNDGHKATFNLNSQLRVLAGHFPSVFELLVLAQPELTAVFLFLLLWRARSYRKTISRAWDVLFISMSIILLYMLVHFEVRFVGASVVLIWLSLFFAFRISDEPDLKNIANLSLIALVIVMLLALTADTARRFLNGCGDSTLTQLQAAKQLDIAPGTAVASIGPGNYAYWAHFAGLKIVSEVMEKDENAFWRLPDKDRISLYPTFRETGARWLIAQPPSALIDRLDTGWQPVGSTGYYRYSLAQTK